MAEHIRWETRHHFNIQTVFPGMVICIIKIGQLWDCLIWTIKIPILVICSALVDNNVYQNVMTFRDKWHVDTQISLSTRAIASTQITFVYDNTYRHVMTFRAKRHVDTHNPLSTRALVIWHLYIETTPLRPASVLLGRTSYWSGLRAVAMWSSSSFTKSLTKAGTCETCCLRD